MRVRVASRWAAPVAVVVLIAGLVSVRAATAESTPTLPERTPAQVLALAGGARVDAWSGTVASSVDLDLPALPSAARSDGGADAVAELVWGLLGGTTTARVAHDGPTRSRVAVLDELAEADLIRNGTDVWTYLSRTNTATHVVLPATSGFDQSLPSGTASADPQALAERLLAAVDPSTAVALDEPTKVAGRDAYVLRVTPRTDHTLVGSATVAVDAATGLPLRVRVDARGSSGHAVDVGFTELRLARPPASTFEFEPPPGATVREHSLDGLSTATAPARPRTFGTGWATVVELPPTSAAGLDQVGPLLAQLTRPVEGGRLVHTALVNLLLTDDGRAYVGAVPLSVLQDAARQAGSASPSGS